ncbi:uncharacterized protein LOC123536490 [Mercenaria mercenaria]|uniref:uncharacterized protein LOC123536490 n=1 Tax=Mercenaria mercenaria TaxID=6596 RepID=UPI00234E9599|nr:uncharacterized protein LOC123536490 [Mercenaria mercenaria]
MDTPFVSPGQRVEPDDDVDDATDADVVVNFVLPSLSANSLDINDFIAQARLESRTASSMEDDFYTNSEHSSAVDEQDETSKAVQFKRTLTNPGDAEDKCVKSTKEEMATSDNEDDDCVLPSASSDSMDINYIYAQARAASRTAANMDDDFCCNDSSSSDEEDPADARRYVPGKTTEKVSAETRGKSESSKRMPTTPMPDTKDDDCVLPSKSGNSIDISHINAQARAASRTAANMDDDFCCNDSSSSDEEDPDDARRHVTGKATENVSAETREKNESSKRMPTTRMSDTRSAAKDDDCVFPSASGDSMDINYIYAQARAASRSAANMDDDFCCNDSTSSDEEDPDNTRRYVTGKTTEKLSAETRDKSESSNRMPTTPVSDTKPEAEDDDCASGGSVDVNYIYAQARAISRSAANMDDDFCCTESMYSVEEGNDLARVGAAESTTEKQFAESRDKSNTLELASAKDSFDRLQGTPSLQRSNSAEQTEYSQRAPSSRSQADGIEFVAEDDNSVLPSASGDSMDINYIYAHARAASRTAANMDDDFCCNDSSSSDEEADDVTRRNVENNTPEKHSVETSSRIPQRSPTPHMSGTAEDAAVLQKPPIQYASSKADDTDSEAENDECVFPSVSGDSMDINYIYAQARAASRTAANMDDDFCCNDSSTSDEEDPYDGATEASNNMAGMLLVERGQCSQRSPILHGLSTAQNPDYQKSTHSPRVPSQADDTDSEAIDGHSIIHSASGDSMDINYIYAQARAASRTAANMDDDFCCNDSTSFDEDDQNDMTGTKKTKMVTFAKFETETELDETRTRSIAGAATPYIHGNQGPVDPGSKTYEALDPSSLRCPVHSDTIGVNSDTTGVNTDNSSSLGKQLAEICDNIPMDNSNTAKSASPKTSARFEMVERVIDGAENDERPVKSKTANADDNRFKNFFQRVIDRSSDTLSISAEAMNALKHCRANTPFLFAHNDNLFMESDEDDCENGARCDHGTSTHINTTADIEKELISSARNKDNSDTKDELAVTALVEDDDDNALQAFYPTSPTEISLTGKIQEINERASSRVRTPCALLDLLRNQGHTSPVFESSSDGFVLDFDDTTRLKDVKTSQSPRRKSAETVEYSAGAPTRPNSETEFYKTVLNGTQIPIVPYAGKPSRGREVPHADKSSRRVHLIPKAGKPSATYTPVIADEVTGRFCITSTEGSAIRSQKECTTETSISKLSTNLRVELSDPSLPDLQSNKSRPAKKKKKGKGSKRVKEELVAVSRLSPTSMFKASVLGPVKSDQNDQLMADAQANSQQSKKKKNTKKSKRVKDELGSVNRLSPTSMFTASLLGPIKSGQNNRLVTDAQTNSSRDNIDRGVIVTSVQVGKTSAAKIYEMEGKILQNVITKLGDNCDHLGQNLVEGDTTPVSGHLQTRSLTVAKFRSQLNRTCILLPEIGEKQDKKQPGYSEFLPDTIYKRDKDRQEKLREFQVKVEKVNRKTTLLLGPQGEHLEMDTKGKEVYIDSGIPRPKSYQNSLSIADRQTNSSRDNIDHGVIDTSVQVGKTSMAKKYETEENISQNVITKFRDNSDRLGQHLVDENTTPVTGCLQTTSLTVAKFRTQLNRTCILLPEIGEKQHMKQSEYADIVSDTTHKTDIHRQEKLRIFKSKMEEINMRAALMLGMQKESKGKAMNDKDIYIENGIQRCHGSHELSGFTEITHDQKQFDSGMNMSENQTGFTPHAPSGPKPSFVRRRKKYRQLSVDEQQKLKLRIEKNEILVPKAPAKQKMNNNSNKVSKSERRIFK